jgi:uncharacterized protein YbjT (DUF2867 family)
MILVVGATGTMGADVCTSLIAQRKQVRALVRTTSDPIKVSRLEKLGVTTITGDLRDRRSLDRACAGITAVIATASSMPFAYDPETNTPFITDRDGMCSLITAARNAQVGQFVYTSYTGSILTDSPLEQAKRTVERCLQVSGLSYTILRPNFFMEVWLSPAVGFDYANARARIFGNGKSPISWISVYDVARYATASLTHPVAHNAVMELNGPEALTALEVVAIFERRMGRPFSLEYVPERTLATQQLAATDSMQQSFAALMRAAARGAIGDNPEQASIGIRLRTVSDYAQRVLPLEAVHLAAAKG